MHASQEHSSPLLGRSCSRDSYSPYSPLPTSVAPCIYSVPITGHIYMVVPVPTTFEGAIEMEVVEVLVYREDRDRAAGEEGERECEVGSSGGGEAKMCLFTDLLGDPLCRIRNSPAYLMLVRPHVHFSLSFLTLCAVVMRRKAIDFFFPVFRFRSVLAWGPARLPELITVFVLCEKVVETANGGGGGNGREIIGLIRGCVKTVVSGGSVQAGKDPIYSKVAYILGLRVSPRYRYIHTYIHTNTCCTVVIYYKAQSRSVQLSSGWWHCQFAYFSLL